MIFGGYEYVELRVSETACLKQPESCRVAYRIKLHRDPDQSGDYDFRVSYDTYFTDGGINFGPISSAHCAWLNGSGSLYSNRFDEIDPPP